jgi:hypothetical protein
MFEVSYMHWCYLVSAIIPEFVAPGRQLKSCRDLLVVITIYSSLSC